ncbi:hypothetical protein BCV69DRAFT_311539 [Microstroma glucosiphilum]|uniref:Nudix hydrolase domain-containing protein n=1 Tax=Pseudomicrostroma glucosiphilum TaxID=1684307 RepID=A0A316U9D4_9BASI|nr:hypothetical protein BCV69DRAFT_311539 [Pseudomicrostroma glucosiphilum]PWN21826.1 hypothetical protein BCV69DRAFT_311539 [Pseudomicrostroma glucosiphilum]
MSSSRGNKPRAGPLPNDAKSGPKGEAMTPIPSASLIVLCPPTSTSESSEGNSSSNGGSSGGSSGLTTLMLQRSARMGSSFRSAVVFPGGALDLADQDAVTDSRGTETLEEEATRMAALQICSLRETFEETGLLLLPSERGRKEGGGEEIPWSRAVGHREAGLSVEEWRDWREKVHQDASTFRPFLTQIAKNLQIVPPPSSPSSLPLPPLTYFSHWITPRSVVRPGKRFSAHFFLTVLDLPPSRAASLAADLSADGTETLSLRLSKPEEFVREALEDRLVLYPPQFYILADLAMLGGGEAPGAMASFEERVGRLRPLAFGGSVGGQEQSTPSEASQGSSPSASASSRRPSSPKPTAVEEEPRDLPPGMNYAWDRHTPKDSVTGWVATESASTSQRKGSSRPSGRITSVEPRALPKLGGSKPKSMPALDFGKWEPGEIKDAEKESKSQSQSQSKSKSGEEEEAEAPFIFPLVLPGDHRASPTRQALPPSSSSARPKSSPSASPSPFSKSTLPPLNRVYVSPRSHEDGGGLVASGAVRRGLPGLRDWRVGVGLVEDERADAGVGHGVGKKGKL